VAKKREKVQELKVEQPKRAKLSAKESLKRMEEFAQRKGKFVATIREGKNRSVSA